MQQQDTLLIACGNRDSRNHLRTVLQEKYNLLEASNSRQMMLLLGQNMSCIAAVVLDISNWDVIDRDISSDPEAIGLLKQLPVIIIAPEEAYQELTLYFHYGAADVIPLNYDPYAMLRRIETITQLSLHRRNLEAIVEQQQESLRQFSDNMVDALSAIIEYRSLESGLHTLRIRNFTRILVEEVMRHCPEYGLTDAQITMISSASVLHDVGKIGIPDAILSKPGKLTEEEWEIMKTHALLGCEMLKNLDFTVDQDYLRYAYNICRYHHERWDGAGYPDGLAGDDIPICAQVVGLADCFDALTSKRVYKEAYSCTRAVNMILHGECGAFSQKLLECFKNVSDQFIRLSMEYADGRNPEDAIADMSLPAVSAQEDNVLEKVWAKYYTLVHYLNAFLVEVQLDTDLFQVVYNPFPELAQVQNARTQQELIDILACQIVVPEEKERAYQVLLEEAPKFVRQDLRRQSYYFHHRPYADEASGPFEMTFLRIPSLNKHPSMAILCRKLDRALAAEQTRETLTNFTDCTYVCRNDSGFTLVRVGRDTRSLGGYTPQEVMDIFGGRLLDMAFPEDQKAIRAEFDRQLKNGSVVYTEYRFICKDGTVGWVVNKSRLVIGDDGQEYIHTFLTDITRSKVAYDRMSQTLERYKIILAQTENVLFELDVTNGHIELSDTWEQIFGYKPSAAAFSKQLSGETHIHPDDIALLMDRMQLVQKGVSNYEVVEIRIATVKGHYLWCRVRGTASRDANGTLTRILGIVIVIDAEKRAQQELEDKANRDALTQLLNKEAGKRQAEKYLSTHQGECALMILDLDNFKEVNDRYGHLFGDALLTHVSGILTSIFHSQDIVARIGGDEFMVLVRGVSDKHLLTSQCRRLRDMLQTFQNESLQWPLGFSIGIAQCPEHGRDYYELFTKADRALYQAKVKGKNDFCFYDVQTSERYVHVERFITPIDSDNATGESGADIAYQTFKILYKANDVAAAVQQVMALMGRMTNVSRVYIFENSDDDTYCINTFEWCNEGIEPQIQDLQYVSYETDIPDYEQNFNEEGVFYCHDVRDLPDAAYAVLEPQGIKSMLHCAIRYNGAFKGYIGFDECDHKRLWTKKEIGVLSYCSEILTLFLMKHREQERLRRQVEEYRAILESQRQWVCIVDPKSYELKHLNGAARRENSGAQLGKPCYQALFGKQQPCANCAMTNGQGWAILKDERRQETLMAEAAPIDWHGERCCMLTCRALPGGQALKRALEE